MKPATKRGFVTNQERTAETKQALIDATLEIMWKEGAARTTLSKITRHAGTSGALAFYHFHDRNTLMTAAMRYHFDTLIDAISHGLQKVSKEKSTSENIEIILGALWDIFSSKLFAISIENIVEARTNIKLKEDLKDDVVEYHQKFEKLWHKTITSAGITGIESPDTLNFIVCTIRGLAVQRTLKKNQQYYESIISELKKYLMARSSQR